MLHCKEQAVPSVLGNGLFCRLCRETHIDRSNNTCQVMCSEVHTFGRARADLGRATGRAGMTVRGLKVQNLGLRV